MGDTVLGPHQAQTEYTSNFTNRLRQIRRIGERNVETRGPADAAAPGGPPTHPRASVTGSVPLTTLAHVADFTMYA